MSETMFIATLVEMGFDQNLAKIALGKTGSGSVQAAMDWILANPDFDVEAAAEVKHDEENKPDVPKVSQTPEERAAAAAALQERLNKAREVRIAKEKAEKIEKEKERREQGKKTTSTKDTFEQIQMKKMAELRKKEKLQAASDKERVRKQIQEDKERRKRAADDAKSATSAAAVAETSQVTQEIKKAATERVRPTNTRLQIRLPDGSRRVQVFEADDSLKVVRSFVSGIYEEGDFDLVSAGPPPVKFSLDDDTAKSLDELNLCPSAVVMVQKMKN